MRFAERDVRGSESIAAAGKSSYVRVSDADTSGKS